MTDKELYRLGIIQRVFDRALFQRDAADILKLSVRQVQRLVRLYRTDGATAFASSRRGRPANNRIENPGFLSLIGFLVAFTQCLQQLPAGIHRQQFIAHMRSFDCLFMKQSK
ncbi:TPA: helix-turn-helix domain-containing protein [Klebsiella pneumoniae]|nr:helix-turn-helix domain-containing protein [Klebsiella pneumoniae]HBW7283002.1 helix-turn-helix domain-containing protein [Klebsiella pneumoniae]HBW7294204.1 helix-turn-helix domain-containing protein [Klebsiella pneumoniae]